MRSLTHEAPPMNTNVHGPPTDQFYVSNVLALGRSGLVRARVGFRAMVRATSMSKRKNHFDP